MTPSGSPRRAQSTPATSSLRKLLPRAADLLVEVGLLDRVAITGERTRPGQDGVVVASEFVEDFAVMVLDDRVRCQLIGSLFEVVEGEIELAVFVIGPADAVEIRAVIWIDGQRALDVVNRFTEPL